MNAFIGALNEQLDHIRAQGLYRELRRVDSAQRPRLTVEGRELLNFSSNDYLGLANDPALRAAALEALGRFGAGAGASRLICGSLAPHHDLEQALAEFKGTEAALVFSSGYAAALGTIGALAGKDDVIILDKLVHACMVDAARLCGAKLRVFGHNDLNELEAHLKWADHRQASAAPAPARRARTLIVTESVFSMDGDFAPLRDLVALKDQYGAWLMLDEAHATGLYGNHRRGLAEAWDVAHRVEVHMGTLGKACGAAGGCICGPRALIDLLVNRARSFIFSTAPIPAMAAAAAAGVRLVQSPEGERRLVQLQERVQQIKYGLPKWASLHSPLSTLHSQLTAAPIRPLILGDEARAVSAAAALRERGIFIPAIRYPAVARGAARLRLTVTAAHTSRDVEQLLAALNQLQSSIPFPQRL